MKRIGGIIGGLFLAVLAWAGAVAQAAEPGGMRASKPAVKVEIIEAIDGQLAAFRKNEVGRAYAYASTGLQQQTPIRRFAALVRDGYPEIWANARAEYGLVRDDGARATVTVRVFVESGRSAVYDYVLAREDDVWRIAGVLRHEAKSEKKV
ncbi:MAG: hypothetical protein CK548_04555 [Opitutia bacterium]|nr:DUF4864 domain-containing protein [Opitutaceae bacterium]PHX72277.1 MAG: hypothetical protein CK548_04555 [Opitutae bacterium]